MKATELRQKNVEELNKELIALRTEAFNLRVQKSTGQSPKTHLIKKVKLDIARIKTVISEKEGSNV